MKGILIEKQFLKIKISDTFYNGWCMIAVK